MITIVGISGSLRKGSFNTMLLRCAAARMPEGAELRLGHIRDIPLYNGDIEAEQGIPAPVAALKDAIADAHGLLLVTPEYNNSIPGVFKNAVDWLSRPPADIPRVFAGRPVAVIGASPGAFGTVMSQNAWLPVLRTLQTRFWSEGRLQVSRAPSVFTDEGELADAKTDEALRKFLAGFVEFASARVGAG